MFLISLCVCVCVCAFGVSSALSGLILGQAYKSLGQVSVGYQKKVVIICYYMDFAAPPHY